MLDGRLSRQHADRIRKLENIRVAWAMLRDQHLFVQWANDLEWRSFTKTCAYWLLVNDQDGVSNFVRTSLLAPGGQNAHTVPMVLVCALGGRLRREGSAAREVTMSDSADVDRLCRRVGDEICSPRRNSRPMCCRRLRRQPHLASRRPQTTPLTAGPNKPGQSRPPVLTRQQIQSRRPATPETPRPRPRPRPRPMTNSAHRDAEVFSVIAATV